MDQVKNLRIINLGLIVFVSILSSIGAATIQIDRQVVDTITKSGKVDILVSLTHQATLDEAQIYMDRVSRVQYVYDQLRFTAKKTQSNLLAFLDRRNVRYQSFYIVNAVLVEDATKDLVEELSKFIEISRVSLNFRHQLQLPQNSNSEPKEMQPEGNPQDNVMAVGADRVWNELGVKGKGIVVAGQDSGYDWMHESINMQYRGNNKQSIDHNYNWHDAITKPISGEIVQGKCSYNSMEPCDDSAHGTHTMGTMIGSNGANEQIGVAPEAKWIGCRNMDRGNGVASSYLECFEFLLAPYPLGGNSKTDGKPEYAPHVINNSWGCPASEGCKGDEFITAVRAMKAAGIMVVVSTGNSGPSCGSANDAPGFYSGEVMSVAAFDHRTGNIAGFSSRGPSTWNGGIGPNITAPGVSIRSSVPIKNGKSQYSSMSGTSMSGPHVVGVVALLWSARPELIGNIDETMNIIQKTAMPRTTQQDCGKYLGNQIPNAVWGYGTINAFKAITMK